MAFLNLSSLISNHEANGNNLDEVSLSKPANTALVAHIPLTDFLDRLVDAVARDIDGYYSRLSRVLYEDLKKEKDSLLYQKVRQVVETNEYIREKGEKEITRNSVAYVLNALEYINIDNCIRIKFTDKSDLANLLSKTISYDKTLSKDFFRNVIYPYIIDYVNPRLEFTERDKAMFDYEVKTYKDTDGTKSMYDLGVCNFPVPVHVGSNKEIMTYAMPKFEEDGVITLDGIRMTTDVLNKDKLRLSLSQSDRINPELLNDLNDFNGYFNSLSLSQVDRKFCNEIQHSIGFKDELPEGVSPYDVFDVAKKGGLPDNHSFLRLMVKDEVSEEYLRSLLTNEDVLAERSNDLPFHGDSIFNKVYDKQEEEMRSFWIGDTNKYSSKNVDILRTRDPNGNLHGNPSLSSEYNLDVWDNPITDDERLHYIALSLKQASEGFLGEQIKRACYTNENTTSHLDHTPITSVIRNVYYYDDMKSSFGAYDGCDGFVYVSIYMYKGIGNSEVPNRRKFRQLFKREALSIYLDFI